MLLLLNAFYDKIPVDTEFLCNDSDREAEPDSFEGNINFEHFRSKFERFELNKDQRFLKSKQKLNINDYINKLMQQNDQQSNYEKYM
jgi:hypothetical protein